MGSIRNKYALAPSTVPYKQTTFVFTRQHLWSHRNSRFEIYRFKPAILIFTRATSQSPCLHETLTTAAIMSKIREAYFISLLYCLNENRFTKKREYGIIIEENTVAEL